MRFLPIVTQIFLWKAIFDAIEFSRTGVAGHAGGETIAGYNYHDFVAYYLLTMVGRAFSSMPGLASGIALQIRNGEIKKFLIQPIDLVGFLLSIAWPTSWSITRWPSVRSRWCSFSAAAFSPAGPTRRRSCCLRGLAG